LDRKQWQLFANTKLRTDSCFLIHEVAWQKHKTVFIYECQILSEIHSAQDKHNRILIGDIPYKIKYLTLLTIQLIFSTMKKLTFLFVLFATTILGYSQTNTWQGDVTSNWHYSANWSLNHIPTSAEDVIIPDVVGFNPIVYGDAHCNNLTINSGAHLEVANTISVGGDYDNNAGSLTEINQITFNGDDIQNVYSLDCETLILDKPDGELRFPSETSTCNNYDWEQGLYRVNGGTFIINDLVDDGIFGTISVTDGQLDIHQDIDQFVDLNCTFFMTGGECNIYGGQDDSWWSYAGNTTITMYDGTLSFKYKVIKDMQIC